MFNTEILVCLAADVFRSVAVNREFRLNLCRAMLRMVEQGRLVLNTQSAPYFSIKADEEAVMTSVAPHFRLPPSLHHISERKKARLRATYAQAKHIWEPNATCSPQKPIKLFGPNAATNVALWPSAMQVNLEHEYKGGESSSKLSPGEFTNCINSKPDVAVRGAITVLTALVNGLDEEWLEAPGVAKHSKTLMAPEMTRSYGHEGQPIPAEVPLSPGISWIGSPSLDPSTSTTITGISSPHTGHLYARVGSSAQACDPATEAPWISQVFAPSGSLLRDTQAARSWKETYDAIAHNKDRLRATFERTQAIHYPGSCVRLVGQPAGSASKVALHGTDGTLNVALYPRAILVRLNMDNEDKLKTVESMVQDATETIEGAIIRLDALINGVGYDWLDMARPDDLEAECGSSQPATPTHFNAPVQTGWADTHQLTHSYTSLGPLTAIDNEESQPARTSVPQMTVPQIQDGSQDFSRDHPTKVLRMARPHSLLFCGPQSAQSWTETHEAAPHNKDRLRATFERVVAVYQPGSYIRPTGQRPGSNFELALHGVDGTLNVALYPRVMLVRLNMNEEDKIKAMESTVQGAAATVEGAIDRLNALVGGIGYDWLGTKRPCGTQSEAMAAHLSRSSVSSGWSDTSEVTTLSSLVTPLDQVFPFNARHTSIKL